MIDPWLTEDPFWSAALRALEKLKEVDVIAITHAHFDHSSGVSEIVQHNGNVLVVAQLEYAL